MRRISSIERLCGGLFIVAVGVTACRASEDQLRPLPQAGNVAARSESPPRNRTKPGSASSTRRAEEPTNASAELSELVAALQGTSRERVANAYLRLVDKSQRLSDEAVRSLMQEQFIAATRNRGYSIGQARALDWVFINMLKDTVLAGHDPRPSFALLAVVRPLHRKPLRGGDGLNHDVEGTERTIDDPALLTQFVQRRAACERSEAPSCRVELSKQIVALRMPEAIEDNVPTVPLAETSAQKMHERLVHSLATFLPGEPKAQAALAMLKSLELTPAL